MKKRLMILSAGAMLAVLAGCGAGSSGVREIKISTTEMKYEPAVVQVKPGEKVKVTVENKGTVDHEFESEELNFDELEIPPGKTRSVEFTVPEKAGEYEFFCDAAGHKAAGMIGKVVVSE